MALSSESSSEMEGRWMIFMSGLLNTLRANPSARFCPLSSDDKSNLRWWCHFLPQFNGVTLIKSTPWLNNPFLLSSDACTSGAVFSHSFSRTHPGAVWSRHQHPRAVGSHGGVKAVGFCSSCSALYSQLWPSTGKQVKRWWHRHGILTR